jgi:DNA-binding winged helix-turn-helix (wHTH) protein
LIPTRSGEGAPLRFGDCRFDLGTRELRRGEEAVPLTPRAFQLLALLLEHRPRALSHHQLHDALWPDAHVGYTSLAQLVTELRKAIGDTAPAARLIRTVPRFGYAFVGPVKEERGVPTPTFAGTLIADDREYAIAEGETLVGRGAECGVRLPSARVSRVHARLRAEANRVWVEDAGSKNGTWVNGERRDGPAILHDGDELVLGNCRLLFQQTGTSGSTHTMAVRPRPASRESTG